MLQGIFRFLNTPLFHFRLPTDLHHSFQLSSVYSHYLPDSGVPEVTTCHSRSAVTVDYIFYSAARDNVTQEPGNQILCQTCGRFGTFSSLVDQVESSIFSSLQLTAELSNSQATGQMHYTLATPTPGLERGGKP